MAISSIAAFWAVAALLIAVPGADWAYVIGTVLAGRPVVVAVSGLVIGYAGITIVVAAGVGAMVARTPVSLTVLTIAGGLYLLWLGVRTLRRPAGHGPAMDGSAMDGSAMDGSAMDGPALGGPALGGPTLDGPAVDGPAPGASLTGGPAAGAVSRTDRATLVRGIGVSGLNPKGLLVFLAVLPQFATPRGTWPLAVQLGILGLVFTLTCAVFYLSMGSFARRILEGRPAAARVISRLSGTAMIILGVLLLGEHLVH
jgi:threonine/homoserine/homoserine lactone efflux protein